MELEEIKPLEGILKQVSCFKTKSGDGVLIVTTCRLLFKEFNQSFFSVQIPRTLKIQVQRREQK